MYEVDKSEFPLILFQKWETRHTLRIKVCWGRKRYAMPGESVYRHNYAVTFQRG